MTTPDLSTMPCTCGHTAIEVIHAAANVRRGWWCPLPAGGCGGWRDAVWRECVLEKIEQPGQQRELLQRV